MRLFTADAYLDVIQNLGTFGLFQLVGDDHADVGVAAGLGIEPDLAPGIRGSGDGGRTQKTQKNLGKSLHFDLFHSSQLCISLLQSLPDAVTSGIGLRIRL